MQSPSAHIGIGVLFTILSRIEGFTACFPSRTFCANFSFFWRISNAVGCARMCASTSGVRQKHEDPRRCASVQCSTCRSRARRRERNGGRSARFGAVARDDMASSAYHLELGIGVDDVSFKEWFRRASSARFKRSVGRGKVEEVCRHFLAVRKRSSP